MKILNFLDPFQLYGRLLENQKAEGSEELFLSENNFKNSSAKLLMPKRNSADIIS